MVLHNDKWKQKAKRAVERKHQQKSQDKGFLRKNDEEKEGPTSTDLHSKIDSDKNDSCVDGTDNENGNESESEIIPYKELESNEWRFTDPVVDETILKDPEYIQQLENERIEEENRMKQLRETVVENLKGRVEKFDDDLFYGSKELKDKKDLKIGNFSNWSLVNDSEEEEEKKKEVSTGKSEIREFTDEEKLKFLELQKKIKHQKALEEMKSKIDRVNHKDIKNNVLEIHGSQGKENYRSLVDRNLDKLGRNDLDLDQHDQLVEQMLGVNLQNNLEPRVLETFDLDTMINNPSSAKSGKNSTANEHKAPFLVELDNLDEDFLESIL